MPNLLLTDPAQPVAPRQATPEAFGSEIGQEMQRLGHATNLLGQTVAHVGAQVEHSRGRTAAIQYDIALKQAVGNISLNPDIAAREGLYEKTNEALIRQFKPTGIGERTFSERAGLSYAEAKVNLLGQAARDGISEARSHTRREAAFIVEQASDPSLTAEQSIQRIEGARLPFAEDSSAFMPEEQVDEFNKTVMAGLTSMVYKDPKKVVKILDRYQGTLGPDGALREMALNHMRQAATEAASAGDAALKAQKAEFQAKELGASMRLLSKVQSGTLTLDDISQEAPNFALNPSRVGTFTKMATGGGASSSDRGVIAKLERFAAQGVDLVGSGILDEEFVVNERISKDDYLRIAKSVDDNTVQYGRRMIVGELKPSLNATPAQQVTFGETMTRFYDKIEDERKAGKLVNRSRAAEIAREAIRLGRIKRTSATAYATYTDKKQFTKAAQDLKDLYKGGQILFQEYREKMDALSEARTLFDENAALVKPGAADVR